MKRLKKSQWANIRLEGLVKPVPSFEVVPAVKIAYGRLVEPTGFPYATNPLAMVWQWIALGAQRIHVEEMGILSGAPTVPALLLGCRGRGNLQVGGGIRDVRTAQLLTVHGAHTLVIRHLLRDPGAFCAVTEAVPANRLVISVGLHEMEDGPLIQSVEMARAAGVRQVILSGGWSTPSVFSYQRQAISTLLYQGFEVWAAGGIRHESTIGALKALGLSGVIVGKALHEGTLNFEAIQSLA